MGLKEYEGVEFEDEKYMPEATVREKGGFYGYLLAKGIVKNQNQANVLLVITAVLILIIAYMIFYSIFHGHDNAPDLTPEDSYRAGNPSEIDNTLQ